MSVFFPAKNSGQVSGVQCYTAHEVKKESGFAVVIKVEGGWKAFETMTEYNAWRKAKRQSKK